MCMPGLRCKLHYTTMAKTHDHHHPQLTEAEKTLYSNGRHPAAYAVWFEGDSNPVYVTLAELGITNPDTESVDELVCDNVLPHCRLVVGRKEAAGTPMVLAVSHRKDDCESDMFPAPVECVVFAHSVEMHVGYVGQTDHSVLPRVSQHAGCGPGYWATRVTEPDPDTLKKVGGVVYYDTAGLRSVVTVVDE